MCWRREQETPQLSPWSDVAVSAEWSGLLLGNGASIAVHDAFRYDSLFEVAEAGEVDHALQPEDIALFDAFGTTNFEQILSSLKTASRVLTALQSEEPALRERYDSIQRALFEAVHAVHVPWTDVCDQVIPRLHDTLRDYSWVYSTNYDLLAYWASMQEGGAGFLDFLWGGGNTRFEALDTTPWPDRESWTKILFLHGGIHLRRLQGGGTRKATSAGGNLLDQFITAFEGDATPLLVSEGDSSDKLRSIDSSDYLSFARRKLIDHEGGLVVFGHSLGEADDHFVRPIAQWLDSPVAVAVRAGDDTAVVQSKALYRQRLAPNPNIQFFDASTHPLSRLKVPPADLSAS